MLAREMNDSACVFLELSPFAEKKGVNGRAFSLPYIQPITAALPLPFKTRDLSHCPPIAQVS